MGEKMTLEAVRDFHLRKVAYYTDEQYPRARARHQAMADAIDAHLTQPARAVDVVAWRWRMTLRADLPWNTTTDAEVIRQMQASGDYEIEPLTRALGNAQAEGWKVMRFTGSAPRPGDRWEVYGPDGSGGVVATQDVPSHVCGLLDALSPTPPQPEE